MSLFDRQLFERAIATFTLGPLILFFVYLGGWYYFIAVSVVLVIATFEYANLVEKLNWRTPIWLLLPAVIAQWIFPLTVQETLFGDYALNFDLTGPFLLVGSFMAMCYALWLFERHSKINSAGSWVASTAGIVLLGWLGSHFFRLQGLEEMAAEWTGTAILGTWFADSAAYVFGKTFGRHKLAPRLSPNKTIEGYIGGAITGIIATLITAMILNLPMSTAFLLGILVSFVSPIGDLGISLLKRMVGVKDSGNLLPGHGGALDRVDSLLWSVAMAYYLVELMV